jgi:hypothetical protein
MLTIRTHRVTSVLFTLLAIGLAGACAHPRERGPASAAPPTASPWALPTSTMRWNEHAWDLIARHQIGQFPSARTFAYMNLAINNAIVAAHQQGHKPDGAAAGAAATVLAFVFPKDEQAIAGRLAGETESIGAEGRSDFAAGVQSGVQPPTRSSPWPRTTAPGPPGPARCRAAPTSGRASFSRPDRRSVHSSVGRGPFS